MHTPIVTGPAAGVAWLILAALALLIAQTLIAPSIQYLGGPGFLSRLRLALGPRDDAPPLSPMAGRAQRALSNLFEALPVFLTLAILSLILPADRRQAFVGAAIFIAARVLYVPAYLSGLLGLRTLVWSIGLGGLVVMAAAVLKALWP